MTMADVRRLNREKGQYFFSPDTMKFFDSRVESELIGNRFFVTSEQFSGDPALGVPAGERLFSVREFDSKTGRVKTYGDFQKFKTRAEALNKAKELVGG
jgi:hypothetical protein